MGIFSKAKVIGLVGVLVVGTVGAGICFAVYHAKPSPENSATMSADTATIRTPAWYVAHQDALRADNVRCQNEGSTLPPGFCENVTIANHTVGTQNLIQALDADKQ